MVESCHAGPGHPSTVPMLLGKKINFYLHTAGLFVHSHNILKLE